MAELLKQYFHNFELLILQAVNMRKIILISNFNAMEFDKIFNRFFLVCQDCKFCLETVWDSRTSSNSR